MAGKKEKAIKELAEICKMNKNKDFTSFVKYDENKPAYELLDPYAINEIVRVLTYGAKKYNAHNWNKCNSITRYFGACLRHLFAWLRGEDIDPESGIHHLAHAGCSVIFMLGLWGRYGSEVDDRANKLQ